MDRIENNEISASVKHGVIVELFNKNDTFGTNYVSSRGSLGTVGYTLVSDDITKMKDDVLDTPYACRKNSYSHTRCADGILYAFDNENSIETKYYLDSELVIESECSNRDVSQFALCFDFNFMGYKGTEYKNQLLPTSPYTSEDGNFTYCIMTIPRGGFMVLVSESRCEGWKIDYRWQHYIDSFQVIADFDKLYKKTENKYLKVRIFFSETIDGALGRISKIYGVPYASLVLSGGFYNAVLKFPEGTDSIEVVSPSKNIRRFAVDGNTYELDMPEYGLYTVYPYRNGIKGMSANVWFGKNDDILFKKSMNSVSKPYHSDYNLCEGGMFVWAMLAYMRRYKNFDYESTVKQELEIIMGENGNNVPRRTILPYETDYPAYHISGSDRIQEQFTGISILLEAYKVFGDEKYLEHAVLSLTELVNDRIDDGRIWCLCGGKESDYTTVCAPVIAIADMALFLEENGDARGKIFKSTAVKVADYLVGRGFDFPTEGVVRDGKEREYEDGSISCTALSVLYVCKKIKYKEEYINFAKEILSLHNAWTMYTPDARMYQSSFRWWETIWEGDGDGPAICAGHAWAIWRAEALFWYGLLTSDDKALLDSWNGYVTNFAKITFDGKSYSCFEPDFIKGGGMDWAKSGLLQLKGEDLSLKYEIGHSYPKHTDNSLSRYVWARYDATWQDSAAIVCSGGEVVGINAEIKSGVWNIKKNIKNLIIGSLPSGTEVRIKSSFLKNIYSRLKYEKATDADTVIIRF